MKKQTKQIKQSKQQPKQWKSIIIVAHLLSLFFLLITLFKFGIVGTTIDNFCSEMFSYFRYILYFLILHQNLYYLWKEHKFTYTKKYYAVFLILFGIFIAVPTFDKTYVGFDAILKYSKLEQPLGGFIAYVFYGLLSVPLGRLGVIVLSILMILIGVVIFFGKEILASFYHSTKHKALNYREIKQQEKSQKQQIIPVYDLRKAKKQESVFITLPDTPTPKQPNTEFGELIYTTEDEKFKIPTLQPIKKSEEKIITPKNDTNKNSEVGFNFNNSKPKKHTLKEQDYDLPELDLLKDSVQNASQINEKNAAENGKKIIEILNQFQIQASLQNISIGPSVTRFEIKPESGVRVNRIATLQHDIKMALAAKYLRIEAPIPGKSAVGIEIANEEKEMVYMKDVIKTIPNKDSKLLFVLGKDLTGNSIYGELDKMPHLLVAGATGSGKSVCVNSIITSILLRSTPEEVRILLIDPKKVEFTPYKNIPHLVAPIITDATKASRALEVIVSEMDRRYDIFSQNGVKNIKGYHDLQKKNKDADYEPMPYIMVVIDELADLMMVASKKVEASIQRITQLARAAGIHLIVATQRPSVDVITGVIKSNIPSRIAFAVSSAVDSRTILDESGAEKLLGYGDMLYIPVGENSPIRVQGVYVSDEEVENIALHTERFGKVEYMDVFQNLEELDKSGAGMSVQSDELYAEVKAYVLETKKASTSLIQRRFSLGYSRAAKLIDMLEANGVIGPQNGNRPRDVYDYED